MTAQVKQIKSLLESFIDYKKESKIVDNMDLDIESDGDSVTIQSYLKNGDCIDNIYGRFKYYGIYNNRHSIYAENDKGSDFISKSKAKIKDSLGTEYLGLTDSQLSKFVSL